MKADNDVDDTVPLLYVDSLDAENLAAVYEASPLRYVVVDIRDSSVPKVVFFSGAGPFQHDLDTLTDFVKALR